MKGKNLHWKKNTKGNLTVSAEYLSEYSSNYIVFDSRVKDIFPE